MECVGSLCGLARCGAESIGCISAGSEEGPAGCAHGALKIDAGRRHIVEVRRPRRRQLRNSVASSGLVALASTLPGGLVLVARAASRLRAARAASTRRRGRTVESAQNGE